MGKAGRAGHRKATYGKGGMQARRAKWIGRQDNAGIACREGFASCII